MFSLSIKNKNYWNENPLLLNYSNILLNFLEKVNKKISLSTEKEIQFLLYYHKYKLEKIIIFEYSKHLNLILIIGFWLHMELIINQRKINIYISYIDHILDFEKI